jgi:hypothetical protein
MTMGCFIPQRKASFVSSYLLGWWSIENYHGKRIRKYVYKRMTLPSRLIGIRKRNRDWMFNIYHLQLISLNQPILWDIFTAVLGAKLFISFVSPPNRHGHVRSINVVSNPGPILFLSVQYSTAAQCHVTQFIADLARPQSKGERWLVSLLVKLNLPLSSPTGLVRHKVITTTPASGSLAYHTG